METLSWKRCKGNVVMEMLSWKCVVCNVNNTVCFSVSGGLLVVVAECCLPPLLLRDPRYHALCIKGV